MNLQEYRSLQEAYLGVVMGEGKSSRPRYPAGRGVLDQETRDEKREASAENMRGHTEGPGTVTKNPKKLRKQKSMGELGEQKNIYDIILSHLLDEGYADTQEAALAIMGNMSEEWKDTIVEEVLDEAYVDYRKGKLPSGRTPQQSLNQGIDRNTKKPPSADAQDRNATAKQAKSVGKEMDAHTSFGGKIMKALTPGLGNRSGAAPRVVYGEPNTDRHQRARNRRGESSMKD